MMALPDRCRFCGGSIVDLRGSQRTACVACEDAPRRVALRSPLAVLVAIGWACAMRELLWPSTVSQTPEHTRLQREAMGIVGLPEGRRRG